MAFFFLQAEDGIRDATVTGVQTCALPIFIHRDVKPANIIVDEAGDAHLTDFGLARMIEGSNTLTGSMLMGTPAYVAPEQGRGKRVDGRSDEYSMGVVMYQLADG